MTDLQTCPCWWGSRRSMRRSECFPPLEPGLPLAHFPSFGSWTALDSANITIMQMSNPCWFLFFFFSTRTFFLYSSSWIKSKTTISFPLFSSFSLYSHIATICKQTVHNGRPYSKQYKVTVPNKPGNWSLSFPQLSLSSVLIYTVIMTSRSFTEENKERRYLDTSNSLQTCTMDNEFAENTGEVLPMPSSHILK